MTLKIQAGKIDKSREFTPLNIAVLTISDSRTEADDKSGKILIELLEKSGHHLATYHICKDEELEITEIIEAWAGDEDINIILTTGGTGLTGRDVTPEAIRRIMDKEILGFGELFRLISYNIIGTATIQSRAMAATCKSSYIFALPGSPNACRDSWEHILSYQLDNRCRPCNLSQMISRLEE